MKYKSLFRLMLKAIGVLQFLWAVSALTSAVSYRILYNGGGPDPWGSFAAGLFAPAVEIALALYLFFGGKWIADMAIPGNRPYCHECGYDLTGAVGNICVECGTPFKVPSEVRNEPGHQPAA